MNVCYLRSERDMKDFWKPWMWIKANGVSKKKTHRCQRCGQFLFNCCCRQDHNAQTGKHVIVHLKWHVQSYIYIHLRTHIHIGNMCIHTYINTYTYWCIRTCMHKYIHIYIHACMHTCRNQRANTQSQLHTYRHQHEIQHTTYTSTLKQLQRM